MWDKGRVRHLLFFNGCLFAAAVAVAVYMVLLYGLDFPFRCSFSAASHLYCPGCGFTRAVRALLSFDILASLAAHPFALLGIGVIGYYEVALFRAARGRGRVRAWPAVSFAVGLLCFFVLRNLLLILFGIDFLGDFGQEWGIFAG
ncbi:MAG: DUF2752 domain-containing protein [Clostridia bacterium]|nr:DUF2752 domain-containing protein [Clostridia bacterium]